MPGWRSSLDDETERGPSHKVDQHGSKSPIQESGRATAAVSFMVQPVLVDARKQVFMDQQKLAFDSSRSLPSS